MKRMAILEIHPQAFRDLLQLPEGAEISDLRLNIDRRGVLEVKIDGAGWEVREGECLMRTTGTVTTDENGRRCILVFCHGHRDWTVHLSVAQERHEYHRRHIRFVRHSQCQRRRRGLL